MSKDIAMKCRKNRRPSKPGSEVINNSIPVPSYGRDRTMKAKGDLLYTLSNPTQLMRNN